MKLFLKERTSLTVDNNTTLEIINLEDFLSVLAEHRGKVPAPHFSVDLSYKLIVDNIEYFGKATFDTSKGINSNIDDNCPYEVKLVTWKLGEDNQDKYFEFEILKK